MAVSTRLKIAGAVATGVAGVLCVKAATEQFGTRPRVSVVNLHGTIMPGKGSPLSGKLINKEDDRQGI
jgi:hypothetical protein